MTQTVVLCPKCGYFKAPFGKVDNCPWCGEHFEFPDLDVNTFLAMNEEEINNYRTQYMGDRSFDEELMRQRIEDEEQDIKRLREAARGPVLTPKEIIHKYSQSNNGGTSKALIRCPDCGKEVSSRASSCPNCGCPIAAQVAPIKIRALSDDRKVKYMIFLSNGRELTRVPIGSVATIHISQPTRITMREKFALATSGDNGHFTAIPGKCYEAKFCKPGLMKWTTVASEVSFIG